MATRPATQPTAVPGSSDTPVPTDRVARLRTGAPFCICVFLVLRIALSALGVVGVHAAAPNVPAGPAGPGTEVPATPGWHNVWDGTNRYDAAWFLRIASSGYRDDDASPAFLPVYPIAIRAVSWAVRDELLAALLVSNIAFLLSLIVLHALTEEEYDRPMARRSVVLLAAFPTSFFLLAPYSESLFLLLTLVSFRAARRGGWAMSGVTGAAAAATRSAGLAMLPALAVEAWTRRTRDRSPIAGLAAAGCVLLGPILYGVYWAARGDAHAPLGAQAIWDRRLAIPFVTLGRGVALGIRGIGSTSGRVWTADLLVTAVAIVPLTMGWRRLRPTFAVYAAASLLLPLCYPWAGRPLMSMPRFVVVVFPVAWVWASYLSTRARLLIGVAVGAAGWCVLALWFMNWRPIF